MKVSSKGDYALKAMLELSKNFNHELITIAELSQKANIPKKFLEHILIDLKKGGFVESHRGIVGGYALSRPPSKIRLGDVVETIEGPIGQRKTGKPVAKNPHARASVVLDQIWQEVADSTLGILNDISFDDLLNRVASHHESIQYMI